MTLEWIEAVGRVAKAYSRVQCQCFGIGKGDLEDETHRTAQIRSRNGSIGLKSVDHGKPWQRVSLRKNRGKDSLTR